MQPETPNEVYAERDISDRVFVLSGASKGLGEVLAFRLAERGAKLALCARNQDKSLDALVAKLQKNFKQLIKGYTVDCSEVEQVSKFAKDVEADFGWIDALVCNHGIMPGYMQGLDLVSDELDILTLRVNVLGYHMLTKKFFPLLQKSKDFDRTILYVSSSAGYLTDPDPGYGMISYCASKTANNGIMKAMHRTYVENTYEAQEVRKSKEPLLHRVVSCHPGFVSTSLGKETWHDPNASIEEIEEQKQTFGGLTKDDGIDTLLWLLVAKSGVESGKTYYLRKPHTF